MENHVSFGNQTATVKTPTDELWNELSAIRQESWDYTAAVYRTMDAVVRHCTPDVEMPKLPRHRLQLVAKIIATWNRSRYIEGYWCGFVFQCLRDFVNMIDRTEAVLSLALDEHPNLAGKFVAAGMDAAKQDAVAERHNDDTESNAATPDCYVTLIQMASIVNRAKRTLERLARKPSFPPPEVQGMGGKPSEWKWSIVRPILEAEYDRHLPERFPADRFIRT